MKVKFLAECLSSREKEGRDGGFYFSNCFSVEGHNIYISSEEDIYSPGQNYVCTGDLQISGQKLFLNFKPKEILETEFKLEF